jgi:hypothetical protein
VQRLTSSAGTYAAAEAANNTLLQGLGAGAAALVPAESQLLDIAGTALAIGVALIAAPFIILLLLPLVAVIATALVLIGLFYGFGLIVGGLAGIWQLLSGLI